MNRSKALGKIKKRIEEAKNRWARLGKADYSYNESARLATDALLDGGKDCYQKVLKDEGEVGFFSNTEVQFIVDNVKEPYYANENHNESENGLVQNGNHEQKSESFYPINSGDSDPTTPLHNWSSEDKPYLKDKSSATVYFQSDKANIRETIRRSIHRTSQVLAIMMDEFTDVEIFCDILEAANKRNVFVYLLLDVTKLQSFKEMCEKLQVVEIHLKNICVRSVTGDVYCAKSGKKFFGQIHEKFIISDWRCVLSGTYSFTWLSGQVHRNLLCKFSGHVVELFDEEFRHLYATSKPVMGLKSPAPMAPVLRKDNEKGAMSDTSTQESKNTTSEPFSGSSSISHTSEPPVSPTSITPVQSPVLSQVTSPVLFPVTSPVLSPVTCPVLSPVTSPVLSPVTSPLQRINSFHGYSSLRTPPTPTTNYQQNYFQRSYQPESPTHAFNNNNNIYRSFRTRREDFLSSRFTQGWRFFSKPTMT